MAAKDLVDQEARLILPKLQAADHAYFNLSKPTLTDDAYDKLRDKLQKLHNRGIANTLLASQVKSYLTGTGVLPSNTGREVTLALPMPSLDKVKNDEPATLKKWIDSLVKTAGKYDIAFIASPKLDGASLRLAYDAKTLEFKYATTRGDGVTGRDVTPQALALIELGKIPAKLKPAKEYSALYKLGEKLLFVRCEVIIEQAAFKKHWEGKKINGTVLQESRNAVNGFINATKTYSTRFASTLTVFALTIVTKKMPGGMTRKSTQLQLLRDCGFTTYNHLPGFARFDRDAITSQLLDDLLFAARKGPFTCDGIVVEVNDVQIRHILDKGDKKPGYARAYKLGNSASVASGQKRPKTEVLRVELRPTKDGKQMPLIHYRPVRFGNMTNTKASGVHADYIKSMGIGKGALIEVVRAGDVIPRVDKVLKKSKASLPKKCACGAKLVYVKPNLYCSKPAKCSESQRLRLESAIKSLQIKGLAGAKIGQLYDAGYTTVAKLATVNAVKLSSLDGWGMKTAHVITKAIREALKDADLPLRMELSNVFTEPGFSLSGSRLELITKTLKVSSVLRIKQLKTTSLRAKLSKTKGLGASVIDLFVAKLDAFERFDRILSKKMAGAGIK